MPWADPQKAVEYAKKKRERMAEWVRVKKELIYIVRKFKDKRLAPKGRHFLFRRMVSILSCMVGACIFAGCAPQYVYTAGCIEQKGCEVCTSTNPIGNDVCK